MVSGLRNNRSNFHLRNERRRLAKWQTAAARLTETRSAGRGNVGWPEAGGRMSGAGRRQRRKAWGEVKPTGDWSLGGRAGGDLFFFFRTNFFLRRNGGDPFGVGLVREPSRLENHANSYKSSSFLNHVSNDARKKNHTPNYFHLFFRFSYN